MPALLLAGLPEQTALGTNKMQACCGTALAVRNYARGGLIQWKDVRLGVMWTLVFAALGAWTVTMVSTDFLRRIIPWLLLGIAAYTLLAPRMGSEKRAALMGAGSFALLGGAVLGLSYRLRSPHSLTPPASQTR